MTDVADRERLASSDVAGRGHVPDDRAEAAHADILAAAPIPARWLLALGVVVALVAAVGIPLRADDVSRTTADEPQYLLSALSLWEDGDLDIDDELAERAYEPFHEVTLPTQTRPLDDGRQVSPHDPLLPVVLAVPMGVGGWVAAKATLAVLAGVLAALTAWVANRRFAVGPGVAVAVVAALAVVPPLTTYGTQVYPELPAAVVVVAVVAAVTRPRLTTGAVAGALVGCTALPWLAVKYVPVVAALAAVLAWRLVGDRRWGALGVAGATAVVAAASFGAVHQLVYEGWTAYAAGDHFVDGELTVVGSSPAWSGRSVRLVALLVDARFGLAAWAPAWLLAVPALAAVVRRRPVGWAALALPLAAAWANATWVALTMSGWWWPGRQVVVVLPLAVIALAWWVDRLIGSRAGRRVGAAMAVATAWGLITWGWLVAEVLGRQRDLIIDFHQTSAPTYRLWADALPDLQSPGGAAGLLVGTWVLILGVLAAVGWRTAPAARSGRDRTGTTSPHEANELRPAPAGPIPEEGPCTT